MKKKKKKLISEKFFLVTFYVEVFRKNCSEKHCIHTLGKVYNRHPIIENLFRNKFMYSRTLILEVFFLKFRKARDTTPSL